MEIAWLAVVVLLLIIVVLAWQWFSARSMAVAARAEKEQAATQARDAESRLDSAEQARRAAQEEAKTLAARLMKFEANRGTGGFDADRIYKLLAKGALESSGERRAYGVVQEDSGPVRPFLIDGAMDHLEVGDCFGIIRGKLAKLGEHEFTVESEAGPPVVPAEEPQAAAAPVTQVREAVKAGADSEAPVSTRNVSQETVLFVAREPEQPEDPNKGLPYLAVQEGDEDGEVHHLAFDRLTAGRGPDNDIVIRDDNASRKHFTVSYTANRFLLEDNNSTNGTLCNGQPVSRKLLEFGDRIEVGGTTIRFSCEGYDLKDKDPEQAVAAMEECVERRPEFIDGLKLLAFMLERNVTRKKEAASHWEKVARLERSS